MSEIRMASPPVHAHVRSKCLEARETLLCLSVTLLRQTNLKRCCSWHVECAPLPDRFVASETHCDWQSEPLKLS